MREDENAGQPFNSLQRQRPLAIQVDPATVAPREQVRMSCFGLREPPLGARKLLIDVSRGAADLLVRSLQQLGERQFDVRADPLDLGEAILARLFEKGCQRMLVEPTRRLGIGSNRRHVGRRIRGHEISEHARFL